MIAWEAYKATEGYANTKRWATKPEHTEGSLWAAFEAGFNALKPARVEITEEMVERAYNALNMQGQIDIGAVDRHDVKTALTAALSTAPAKDGGREMGRLTKAQRRDLEKLARPNIVGCSWGIEHKPPHCLVRDGLAVQDGHLQGRPFYKITSAGRAALAQQGSET